MQKVTLEMDDSVYEKFSWFLSHFSRQEIRILDEESISDDHYLRSIDGMVDSILEARNEPIEKSVTLSELDW